ncbi:DUF418 domain-containing protein [Nocardia sp. NPDC057668]|uniref:DUF418 domain-containing protein n=1 Tax=Nocardia sp. NPDC057668 TaxID=3346202 RepID=UPI00366E7015
MRRLESLDVLRGFALCGILFANAPVMLHLLGPRPDGTPDPVSTALDYTVNYRFFPLFALMFGIGFALMWRSVGAKLAAPRRALLQRLLTLLVFGILHQLLQPGEALLPYAIAGLVLLPATLLPQRRIPLVTGVAGIGLLAGGLVVNGQLLLVPGLFLLGFAVGSTALPRRVEDDPRIALWPLLVLVPAVAAGLLAQQRDPMGVALVTGLAMAAMYACLLLAAMATPLRPLLVRAFAPLGRTALTNYIGASVILVLVQRFAAAPLGLSADSAHPWLRMVLLCGVILLVQNVISAWWLTRFGQGPLEKAWRILTYWRSEPPAIRPDPRARPAATAIAG